MPNEPRVPSADQVRRYLAEGLTQAQIAQRWEQDSNIRVSRSAIGMAISRYGLKSAHERPRYMDMIPWTVRPEHTMSAETRLLRLEARRRRGEDLAERDRVWLNNWLTELADDEKVVAYDGRTEQGWWYFPRTEDDDDIVRRPKVTQE